MAAVYCPCAGRCHHEPSPCSLGCWAAQKPWRTEEAVAEALAQGVPPPSERAQAVTLATLVLDRPNADPDDDLAILSRQFLRALERETPAP